MKHRTTELVLLVLCVITFDTISSVSLFKSSPDVLCFILTEEGPWTETFHG